MDHGPLAGRGRVLSFRAIPLDEAIRHSATECLYHPEGPLGGQDVASGLALLREAALDIPVYLVRLEAGYIQRTLDAVSADLISEGRLIPGVTGYAAAFQRDERRVLILVSRAPLRRPPKEPVVWRKREDLSADPPPPAPPASPPQSPPEPAPARKKKRSKGNPETIRQARKRRKRKKWQEEHPDD